MGKVQAVDGYRVSTLHVARPVFLNVRVSGADTAMQPATHCCIGAKIGRGLLLPLFEIYHLLLIAQTSIKGLEQTMSLDASMAKCKDTYFAMPYSCMSRTGEDPCKRGFIV